SLTIARCSVSPNPYGDSRPARLSVDEVKTSARVKPGRQVEAYLGVFRSIANLPSCAGIWWFAPAIGLTDSNLAASHQNSPTSTPLIRPKHVQVHRQSWTRYYL